MTTKCKVVVFEVLIDVIMKSSIFWNVTMCSPVDVLEECTPSLLAACFMLVSYSTCSLTLKMVATCYSKTLVNFHQCYTVLYPRRQNSFIDTATRTSDPKCKIQQCLNWTRVKYFLNWFFCYFIYEFSYYI
jgi:hypothetical protein